METNQPLAENELDKEGLTPAPESPRGGRKSQEISPLVGWVFAGAIASFCLVLVILILTQPEEIIEHYQAPKRPVERMFVAMFPREDSTWFIKLQGPDRKVEELKKEFDGFIRTIQFTDQDETPITWTLPRTWRREPGKGLRYATLRVRAEQLLAVTITKLGPEAADPRTNINRWRNQLHLPPLARDADFFQIFQKVDVPGQEVYQVDLVGREPAGAEPAGPPQYTVPSAWSRVENPGAFRHEAFAIGEGNDRIVVSITGLTGPARGLIDNIKRWRGQLGLGKVTAEDLPRIMKEIQVDGATQHYLDMTGPAQGERTQRLLAVGVEKGDRTWYFTMKGPAAQVEKQRANFETFVQSVRFGGEGANHE